jgi:hypothetical protein
LGRGRGRRHRRGTAPAAQRPPPPSWHIASTSDARRPRRCTPGQTRRPLDTVHQPPSDDSSAAAQAAACGAEASSSTVVPTRSRAPCTACGLVQPAARLLQIQDRPVCLRCAAQIVLEGLHNTATGPLPLSCLPSFASLRPDLFSTGIPPPAPYSPTPNSTQHSHTCAHRLTRRCSASLLLERRLSSLDAAAVLPTMLSMLAGAESSVRSHGGWPTAARPCCRFASHQAACCVGAGCRVSHTTKLLAA